MSKTSSVVEGQESQASAIAQKPAIQKNEGRIARAIAFCWVCIKSFILGFGSLVSRCIKVVVIEPCKAIFFINYFRAKNKEIQDLENEIRENHQNIVDFQGFIDETLRKITTLDLTRTQDQTTALLIELEDKIAGDLKSSLDRDKTRCERKAQTLQEEVQSALNSMKGSVQEIESKDTKKNVETLRRVELDLDRIHESLKTKVNEFRQEVESAVRENQELHDAELVKHFFSACLERCGNGQKLLQLRDSEDKEFKEIAQGFFNKLYEEQKENLLEKITQEAGHSLETVAEGIAKEFNFQNLIGRFNDLGKSRLEQQRALKEQFQELKQNIKAKLTQLQKDEISSNLDQIYKDGQEYIDRRQGIIESSNGKYREWYVGICTLELNKLQASLSANKSTTTGRQSEDFRKWFSQKIGNGFFDSLLQKDESPCTEDRINCCLNEMERIKNEIEQDPIEWGSLDWCFTKSAKKHIEISKHVEALQIVDSKLTDVEEDKIQQLKKFQDEAEVNIQNHLEEHHNRLLEFFLNDRLNQSKSGQILLNLVQSEKSVFHQASLDFHKSLIDKHKEDLVSLIRNNNDCGGMEHVQFDFTPWSENLKNLLEGHLNKKRIDKTEFESIAENIEIIFCDLSGPESIVRNLDLICKQEQTYIDERNSAFIQEENVSENSRSLMSKCKENKNQSSLIIKNNNSDEANELEEKCVLEFTKNPSEKNLFKNVAHALLIQLQLALHETRKNVSKQQVEKFKQWADEVINKECFIELAQGETAEIKISNFRATMERIRKQFEADYEKIKTKMSCFEGDFEAFEWGFDKEDSITDEKAKNPNILKLVHSNLEKIQKDKEEKLTEFREEMQAALNEKRELHDDKLARHFFTACLDQCAGGQVLLGLINQIVEPSHGENQKLQLVSKQFFEDLYTKHKSSLCKNIRNNENLGSNAAEISKEFDFTPWHQALYTVWKDHLGVQEESQILEFKGEQSQIQKSLFNNWICKKTTITFEPSVIFEEIPIVSDKEANERVEIAKSLQKRVRARNKIKKKTSTMIFPRLEQEFLGLSKSDILKENQQPPTQNIPKISLKTPENSSKPVAHCQKAVSSTNLLYGDLQYGSYNFFNSKDHKDYVSWIEKACEPTTIYQTTPVGHLILHAAFFDLASKVWKQVNIQSNTDLKQVNIQSNTDLNERPIQPGRGFLETFISKFADFCSAQKVFAKNNEWAQKVLFSYLQILFSIIKIKLQHENYRNTRYVVLKLTDEQRKYLKQFAALSGFILPDYETPPDNKKSLEPHSCDLSTLLGGNFDCIEKIGKQLQDSEFGLEGLSDSVVQLSANESQVVKTADFRAYVDSLRARSTITGDFARYSLKDVFAYYSMDHDQGQEAIKRAILHAYKDNKEEGIAQLTKWLDRETQPVEMDSSTLLLPKRIFILECLIALGDKKSLGELEKFNKSLINSKENMKIFVGLAREITRLSNALTSDNVMDHFANLLQLKIAYQTLKATYVDGKINVVGFLKLAIDDVELAIAKTIPEILKKFPQTQEKLKELKESDFFKNLQEKLRSTKDSPAFIQKTIADIFKEKEVIDFELPLFLLLGNIKMDVLTGVVYLNGAQRLELPFSIKKHEDIRFLHLQDLTYTKNAQDDFVHSSANDQEPQVVIKEIQGRVVIQRSLPIEFNGKKSALLEYVPRKDFSDLPSVIQKRMEVCHFWKDSAGTVYGYSEKGELIFFYKNQILTTSKGDFVFSKNDPQSNDVFLKLNKILPADEILIQKDKPIFWIPGMELMIEKKDNAWYCSSICGKVLDLEAKDLASTIVFKGEGQTNVPKSLIETYQAFKQEFNELSGQNSLAHKAKKEELQKELLDLELKIASCTQKIYIRLLPHENGLDQGDSTKIQFVILEDLREETLTGRDLSGILFLLSKVGSNEIKASAPWIAELAKYPLKQPLNDKQKSLLDQVIKNNNVQAEIKLYLHLLMCEHNFLMMQEASRVLNANEPNRLKNATKEYKESQELCRNLYKKRCSPEQLPSELKSLFHIHCPQKDDLQKVNNSSNLETISGEAAEQLQGVVNQSLLERLRLKDKIQTEPKNTKTLIESNQKEIISEFKVHSKDQVSGFYWEEFGLFSSQTLYQEFGVDSKNPLFKLNQEKVDKIIAKLKEEQWIQDQSDGYLSVVDHKDPLAAIDKAKLLAILANCLIPHPEREMIADRLQKFFFQASQAHFSFSWKQDVDPVQKLLASQEATHRTATLDAEFALQHYLEQTKISLTEFKCCILTGDTSKLSSKSYAGKNSEKAFCAACNALLCYLVHKTEHQHILNVAKAPTTGERNQIELLSTARQYSIDLLFQKPEELSDAQKQERIIQLAFLLFEEDYGARCNSMQVKLFRSMMLDHEHPEAIDAMQARMGFGKTALLPLMALVQIAKEGQVAPEKKSLIRYVVPKAVLQDNASSFHERISHILGSNVLKDSEFSRYQIDPENRKDSFEWILEDLNRRFDFYNNARDKALVLIQSPEIRQSMEAQEHAFKHLISTQSLSPEEKKLCIACIKTLGKIRSIQTYTIFDELDATQDFRSCEVNFTDGNKLPIEPSAIRPLSSFIEALKDETQITNKEILVRKLFQSINIQYSQELFNYVTYPNAQLNEDERKKLCVQDSSASIKMRKEEIDAALFLIRAIVLDSNIFAFVCNKQPGTHFGVRFKEQEGRRIYSHDAYSESPLLIAVPYEGTNTPKGLSTFDNTEVAAIATLRYYLSNQTVFAQYPHVDFLLKQMQRRAISDEISSYVKDVCDSKGVSLIKRLRNLAGLLDKVEIERAKKEFYEDFLKNPNSNVRIYFGLVVVAAQVRTDEARANSNRYEMGSPSDRIRGCSGTVGNTSSYFVQSAVDPAADGKLSIEIMGRNNNAATGIVDQTSDNYLEGVLNSLLDKSCSNTRAIIDAAGLCKTSDGAPETIVSALWEKLQNRKNQIGTIEGIIYYGKNNIKQLYRGPEHPSIICTSTHEQEALKEKKYFSFYGQKNTRGSDIKQADGAHALVTIDENVSNSDAKQAVLRFRSLVNRSSGQSFTFMLTSKFANLLKNKCGADQICAKDVACYLRQQEHSEQEHNALILFKKEIEAHVQQAATCYEHTIFGDIEGQDAIYLEFLRERKKIVDFIEKGIVRLKDKYGQSLQKQELTNFIDSQICSAKTKLKKLNELADKTCQELNIVSKMPSDFFEKRIEESKDLFKNRYLRQDVEAGAQDTGAEAVAQAQAQAQAVAESIAENISETVVHVHQRLSKFRLSMTKEESFLIEKDWINASKGIPIGQCKELCALVHPWYHQNNIILISPHLQKQKIISHWILKPIYPTNPSYWWISQEEAEHYCSDPTKQSTHTLVDLRTENSDDDTHIQNIKNLALLMQANCLPSINSTDQLRALSLPNVHFGQLLPNLTVTSENPGSSIGDWMVAGSFGISQGLLGEVKIGFRKQGDETFIVEIGNSKVEIPMKNTFLTPLFKDVYGNSGIKNKFKEIKKQFEDRLEQENKKNWKTEFPRKIYALEHDISSIKRNYCNIVLLLTDNSIIEKPLTHLYEAYLKYQGQLRSLRNLGVFSYFPNVVIPKYVNRQLIIPWETKLDELLKEDFKNKELQCCKSSFENYQDSAKEFKDVLFKFMEIFALKDNEGNFMSYGSNLSGFIQYDRVAGALEEDFDTLEKKYTAFIQSIEQLIRANKVVIDSLKFKSFSNDNEFELMDLALKNQKDLLEPLFEEITGGKYSDKIKKLKGIQTIAKQLQEAEQALLGLKEDLKNLTIADKCIEGMKNPSIYQSLTENGIWFFNGEEDREVLWDRFHFLGRLDQLTKDSDSFTLQGKLPEYLNSFEILSIHKKRVCVLNEEEENNFSKQEGLAQAVRRLSSRVEERPSEFYQR